MKSHRLFRTLFAVVAAGAAIATAAQPAAAGEPSTPAAFAAQAKSEGLTAVEARGLQKKIAAILKKDGGTQIAVNRIRWADGSGDTTLPLPGETRARDVLAGKAKAGSVGVLTYGCNYGYFCTWQMQNYLGPKYTYYYCQDYATPYSFNSYENNQTWGTHALMKGFNRNVIYRTPNGAWEAHPYYSGLYSYYIKPC